MKRIIISLSFLGIIATIISINACKKESTTTPNVTSCDGLDLNVIRYTSNIKTILNASCAFSGCHDAVSKKDGIDLSSYSAAKSSFQNAKVICSINHASGCIKMPENASKLSAQTIKQLECWAASSYPE